MSCPKGVGKAGSKIREWTHAGANNIKPGEVWVCPRCNKIIIGKATPPRAFGKPQWMRNAGVKPFAR